MDSFRHLPGPQIVWGPGTIDHVGKLAKELGFKNTLLTADKGLLQTPHVNRARNNLEATGITVFQYSEFTENPDTRMVERGCSVAKQANIDSIIGIGGGSSMDCAKGINFLITNGPPMEKYWGQDKATNPLLPMIAIPTTAGTGSEAQRFALISDAESHVKMACGDIKAKFRIAILDPELTLSQPNAVTAITGYDAIAHAVETYVTKSRNPISDLYSAEAFRLLSKNYQTVLSAPNDLAARTAMQLGAYYAGVAIENSMLGATHACANPLTQKYGTVHGCAIALLLPTVVRFNAEVANERYNALIPGGAEPLAQLLETYATQGNLPQRLRDIDIEKSDLPLLAKEAEKQWTGKFNPRTLDENMALEIYQCAY